ncbi:glycosyltransferase family 9 protein [Candidatus Babeliales bacterium]|nr:glycosyltransferase family 9 protein [Candidatus Babeliales bacterium]
MFDGIVTKYNKHEFDKVYVGDWSRPACMIEKGDIKQKAVWWVTQSPYSGMHEVQTYLDMINAKSADFAGFLTEMADKPILTGKKPRIVLANASIRHGSRQGSKVGWNKFPELSKTLQSLGYDVILVGQGDELKGCVGRSFIDELNIFETTKVISQCDLMVASDTGLMHVADSLNIPLVVLAGPTPMTKAHPLVSKHRIIRKFISCAPCYQSTLWGLCNDPACMKNIMVDDVLKAVFSFRLKKGVLKSVSLPAFTNETTYASRGYGKQSLKVVMPYYGGNDRIDAAVTSWPTDILLLAITDENTTPPLGYESFFTIDNAQKRGLSQKKKPILQDLLQRLMTFYPNEDFYGYVNSDIILPPETKIESLLPSRYSQVAVHHRLDVREGADTQSAIYSAGKDFFIWSAEVTSKIIAEYPEMVLGACNWDDGLVHWLWQIYGKDILDLRYGEVWHKRHIPGWTGNDADGRANGAALEVIGVTTALRHSYDWVAEHYNWLKTSKKIGIIQPGRAGDIIIVLPIAKWYADKGFEVLWPIQEEFLPLFDYIDYVTPVVINKALHLCYEESKKLLQDKVIRVIDLSIGFGRDERDWINSVLTFDEWKYVEADVPFEERRNLQLNRKSEREQALQKCLSLTKPYRLTHSFGHSPGSFNFKVKDAIEIKAVNDFTLFDWIPIIENADKIFCINSCVMNLIEGLKIDVKKSVKLQSDVWKSQRDMLLMPHLKENWTFIDKNKKLPVAFFTIVFNGMPFIKYHLENFKRLNFPWHWYIIEGLSYVAGDPGSRGHRKRGGHVSAAFDSHLSSDGTKGYLDELSKLENVTVIRNKDIWPSKLEMVSSCLPYIKESCLLWQIDVDEFYPVPTIMRLHRMFMDNPDKTAAAPFFYSFISKNKYTVSEGTWGSHRYARIWRYDPGCKWLSHEPPVLVASDGLDLMKVKPFGADELTDLRYYHYNYVTEDQIRFKETYYGYKGLFIAWSALQKQRGKVKVSDYFMWEGIDNEAFVDDWKGRHIIPL